MESPANLPGPDDCDRLEEVPASSSIIASEVSDLEQELRVVRRKARWHFVWIVLGISPAAIIPALGLIREGSRGLLALLAVLVTISQGYAGAKASKKAGELEATLKELKAGE